MTREQLLQAIDTLCQKLDGPLPEAETAAGWTSVRATRCRDMFRKIGDDLAKGAVVPYISVARILDHCNISSGQLLEEACGIDVALSGRTWQR